MSANHDDTKLDVELDRHIGALRNEPAGWTVDGPSVETLARTQAMIDRLLAEEESKRVRGARRSLTQRVLAMTFAQRIAAIVLITLGGLTLYVAFLLFSSLAPSVALADVGNTFKAAHTFVYRSMVTAPGAPFPITMKMMVADPDRVRSEWAGGTTIMITQGHKALILNTIEHTAKLMEFTGGASGAGAAAQNRRPDSGAASLVEAMRSVTDAKGTPAGEKEINGVPCVGFATTYQGHPLVVWADKKTAKAVRAEMNWPLEDKEISIVMDQFQFDPPLDDSLFSLAAPAGYTTETQTMEVPQLSQLADRVASLLGDYARATGGAFPPTLTNWGAYGKVLGKNFSTTNPAEKKAFTDMMTRIGEVNGMLLSLPKGTYAYIARDARLGEKDKIIFFFREKPDSPTARALYADLHIADLPADQLPSTRP